MKSPKIHRVLVARVYRQGRYPRVVDLRIYVADAAIGFRRVSKTKKRRRKNTAVLVSAVELEKNLTYYEIFETILVRTSTTD